MRIIDRYLLRQYVQTFLICFVSLTGMYVVFDVFTNLDEFLSVGEEHGVLRLATTYYACRSIYFFDQTSGMLALVAAMFTVTWIQRHNELVALMAAGVSPGRVVLPLVGLSALVAGGAAANREWLIPRFQDVLARNPDEVASGAVSRMQPRYDNVTEILMRGKLAYTEDQRITEANFLLPPDLDRHGKQIRAANASWRPAAGGRPAGYLLSEVTEPKALLRQPSLLRGDKPIVITPLDAADWLKPDECFVVSDVDFEQLTGGTAWRQFSSTAALIRGLRNRSLDFGADVRVSIHSRLVQPLLDVTLAMLGLPLLLSRGSRNVFLSAGVCLALVCVFLLVTLGARMLGTNVLIDPALAAWVPLLLFAPLAAAMAEPLVE